MAFIFDTDVTLNSGKILQTNTVKLPTESGGSTYGLGSSGQVLMSNGSGVYWSGALHDESIYYGTCSTAAGTQEKAITASNFPSSLKAGQKLCVKFTNGQTYNGQPTLKVNSLDAKSICKFGTTAAARYEWQAGQILCFMYDGTNWIIVDGALANGNYPGKVKLSNSYTSSGGAAADGVGASSKAVHDAYTALNSKFSTGSATAASNVQIWCNWEKMDHMVIGYLVFTPSAALSTGTQIASGLPPAKEDRTRFMVSNVTMGGDSGIHVYMDTAGKVYVDGGYTAAKSNKYNLAFAYYAT